MRTRLLLLAALLATVLVSPDARGATSVQRLAGATRYETAAEVAALLHEGGASTAVVAAGTDYPDALAAGVAAAALDAPLLLASAEDVPIDALLAMDVEAVVLIGGTAALPSSVEHDITGATGASVHRVAGANRFETAAAVAALTAPDSTIALRVSGESFPTALVAAVHAARIGARLLLVPDVAPDAIIVEGATLHDTPGGLNLALLARYPPAGDAAVVTTIASFPDALSAAALAGALDAPVLFTGSTSATQSSINTLRLFAPTELIVVGGSGAVSDIVLQQLFGYAPLPPAVAPGAEGAIALDVFARVNDERVRRGVAPLAWDASLAADAAGWARQMSRSGLRHDALGRGLGENIHHAVGGCTDGACVLPTSGLLHRDWMHAADNRDNVVEPGYVIGGVGVFCAPDGTVWAVERFGIGFGTISSGGSSAAPIARDDIGGLDCTAGHS